MSVPPTSEKTVNRD